MADLEYVVEPDSVQDKPPTSLPSSALAIVPPKDVLDALSVTRHPSIVLNEAVAAAKELARVLEGKPDKVMMNGKQYIENDDWQTVGHFYGVTAKIEADQYVTYGEAHGWEAVAVAVTRDGREVGRASAMCLDDEEKWSTRPKKKWAYCLGKDDDHTKHSHVVDDPGSDGIIWEANPNKPGKQRPRKAYVVIGEEHVPQFQLRSMAQTRAGSKVLRMVLGFVPVLAGFGATPVEELPEVERVTNPALFITTEQRLAIFALAKEHKWEKEPFIAWLREVHDIEDSAHIPKARYDALCEQVKDEQTRNGAHMAL